MNTIYDLLKKKLQVQRREGGISPLELAELPPRLKKVMRLLLRELEMNYPDLCEAVENMPAADRMSPTDLDEALDVLTHQNWLKKDYDRGIPQYRVNLRRKAGSALPPGIWTSLNDRLAQSSSQKNSDQSQEDR